MNNTDTEWTMVAAGSNSDKEKAPVPTFAGNRNILMTRPPTPMITFPVASTEPIPDTYDNLLIEDEAFIVRYNYCPKCDSAFYRTCDYNKHLKKHTRPFKCAHDGCTMEFQYNKDLTRHNLNMHQTGPKVLYCCPLKTCKASNSGGHGFVRKDNLRRHIKNQHPELDGKTLLYEGIV